MTGHDITGLRAQILANADQLMPRYRSPLSLVVRAPAQDVYNAIIMVDGLAVIQGEEGGTLEAALTSLLYSTAGMLNDKLEANNDPGNLQRADPEEIILHGTAKMRSTYWCLRAASQLQYPHGMLVADIVSFCGMKGKECYTALKSLEDMDMVFKREERGLPTKWIAKRESRGQAVNASLRDAWDIECF